MGANTAVRSRAPGFRLRYLSEAGGRRRERSVPLSDARGTRFERVRPVREFPSYPGQRGFPGLWWSSTMRDLVGYESWLKRDQVMMLDFSPQVVAFAAQPFWLTWPDGAVKRRHAPDYFARLADGTGLVIDVRADDDIGSENSLAFAAAEQACLSAGWVYQRAGALAPVLAANLRWLSDYKHPRALNPVYASALTAAFACPSPLMKAVAGVGDPIAVLPSAFHMLWSGRLHADLTGCPLSGSSPVTAAGDDR
jgi:hypothetical protein